MRITCIGEAVKIPQKLTSQLKADFLATLRQTGNVTAAAQKIGCQRKILYNERQKNATFRAQWKEAMEDLLDQLESKLWQKALGQENQLDDASPDKTHKTSAVDERLAMFLLKAHRPEIFGDAKARQKADQQERTQSPREELMKKLNKMSK